MIEQKLLIYKRKYMNENLIENTQKYLNTDSLWHTGLLEILRRGVGSVVSSSDRGALIQDKTKRILMLSASSVSNAEELLQDQKNIKLIVAYQDFLVDFLKEKYSLNFANKCVQAVYLSKKYLKIDERFTFAPLTIENLKKITECYHYESPANLAKKLKNGEIFGAFLDGIWVGFVGMHDEGTMGLLEVFPPFRREGVGTALSSFMINRNLSQGFIPFGHIVSNNEASLALNRKLGLTISQNYLYWIY